MPIRLSGMASGLDTDTIVKELVSAYSTKKDNIVKKQTKLNWTQDAWKSMNTKIYSFYTGKLSGMRLSGSYNKKTATVSNSSVAKVTADTKAVNGTQELKIKSLATSGYLTGGEVGSNDGGKLSGSSKLSDIAGMESMTDGSIELKTGDKTTRIQLSADMTINQFVNKLKDAGVNASFDEGNKRFFISSKKSGAEGDFAITGSDASGNKALQSMGLLSMDKGSAEWAKYEADAAIDVDEAVAKAYAAQMTKDTDAATQKTALEKEQKSLNTKIEGYNKSKEYLEAKADFLRMDLVETTRTIIGDDGQEKEITDYEYADVNTRTEKVDAVKSQKETMEEELKALNEKGDLSDGEKKTKASLENRIKAANDALKELELDTYTAADYQKMSEKADADVADNQKNLDEANARLSVVENALSSDANLDAYVADRNAEIAEANDKLKADLTQYYTELKANAQNLINTYGSDQNGVGKATGAIKITGQDAEIELNGATFTNNTNTFNINGLTIQATAVTGDEAVTITTDTDVDGIYNMVKDFFSSYNELIKSMDESYNAASAKGYEPLTDDEKEAMSDTEVEKWESKIKDSLLRKDTTLGSLSSAMKTIMGSSFEVDGKKLSLANFGIATEGYFAAGSNEKGVYHIDGDADDDKTSGKTDKLRAAIASDPDQVVEFFSKLSTSLYTKLTDKMASSSLSSAYTVYNDKQMTKQYNQYKTDISDWEEKIKNYEDRYYKQFSAMESAMAKLNSQTSQLSGLFG